MDGLLPLLAFLHEWRGNRVGYTDGVLALVPCVVWQRG